MNTKSWLSRAGLPVALAAVIGISASAAVAHGWGKRGSDWTPPSFSELDANGDGGVDAAELLAWRDAQRIERMQSVIERADSDGDGMLGEAELKELMDRRGRRDRGHGKKWR